MNKNMIKIKKVAVIGLGYIGLPTYIALVKSKKYQVVGYTRNQKKVDLINKGISPIEDDGVISFLKSNKITVTNKSAQLIKSDIFIICVPTPVKDDYMPDYEPIISATNLIAPFLRKNCHYVLESTVNPGTCEEIILPILEKQSRLKAGKDFNIAHCPERINPGDKQWNIYNINRNIGSINKKLNQTIADFYRSFITRAKINEISCLKVAEASKIIENTFRDINIAYVNELAQSFDIMRIDLFETIKAAANKPFAFLPHYPGCGVGGHCIAVDPYYLIKRASLEGFNHTFLKNAREINNYMPKYTINRLLLALNEIGIAVKNTKIALLGLSYKPNIGDIRESPALIIEKELKKLGAKLTIFDPYIGRANKNLFKSIKEAKALLIATAHDEITNNLINLLPKTKVKVIVDGRNCLNKNKIIKMKIIYKGIGR